MINFITLPDTIHSYQGADATSIDGNFTTGYYYHASGSNNSSMVAYSAHTFTAPRRILEVRYRLFYYGVSTANYDHHLSLNWSVDYQLNGDSTWYTIPGTQVSYNAGNNGDPGNDHSNDSGNITLAVDIQNVKAIRGYVSGDNGGNNSPDGQLNANIYEIQAYGNIGGFAIVI